MYPYQNLSLNNLPNEEWKPIKNFESLYEISNMGRVKSLGNGGNWRSSLRILKQSFHQKGYLLITLSKNNKNSTPRVHRLVGFSFVSNPYNKPEINHKKGIKIDNRASELEWVTRIENVYHSFETGLSVFPAGEKSRRARAVFQIDQDGVLIKRWGCMADIKRELGIEHGVISRCCRGKNKLTHQFFWRYAD